MDAFTFDNPLIRKLLALLVLALPLAVLPGLFKVGGMTWAQIQNAARKSKAGQGFAGSVDSRKGRIGARMANNKYGYNADGSKREGWRGKAARAAGSTAGYVGGRGARRKYKKEMREAMVNREQQEAIARRVGQLDSEGNPSKLAVQAAGGSTWLNTVAGTAAAGLSKVTKGRVTGEGIKKAAAAVSPNPIGGDNAARRVSAKGMNAVSSLQGEDAKAATTVIEDFLDAKEMQTLAVSGTVTARDGRVYGGHLMQAAAIGKSAREGRMNILEDVIQNGNIHLESNRHVREALDYHLRNNYSSLKAKSHLYNDANFQSAILKGDSAQIASTRQSAALSKLTDLNPEVFAGQDPTALKHLISAMQAPGADPSSVQSAAKLAQRALDSELARKNMTGTAHSLIEQIASAASAAPPAPAGPPAPTPTPADPPTLNLRPQPQPRPQPNLDPPTVPLRPQPRPNVDPPTVPNGGYNDPPTTPI